jgi:membrane protease YdiL (CAAX protease family)
MSILLADSLPTTLPIAPVNAAVAVNNSSSGLFWVCLGWAAVGLLIAQLLGAFGRKSIVGPERLEPTASAWDLLITFFIAFSGGIFADLLLIGLFHPSAGAHMLLLQAPVDLATFFIVILLLHRTRAGSVTLLGLDPLRIGRGVLGGVLTVFVLYPLIQLTSECVELIYDRFNLTKAKPHEILQLLGSTQSEKLTFFAIILAVIVAPLTEELLYRGLLQTSLVRMFGWIASQNNLAEDASAPGIPSTPGHEDGSAVRSIAPAGAGVRWAAVLTSSAIFAAIHVEPAFLAPIFVLALGLGYVYERTGNLWITITAHALFNTAQILLFMTFGRG